MGTGQDSSRRLRPQKTEMERSTRLAGCQHEWKAGSGGQQNDFHVFIQFPQLHRGSKGRHCKEAAAHLAGVHANDTRQLEILLCQAHALGPVGNVPLAHLPALLVLYHAEHSERPVLACNHTAAGDSPATETLALFWVQRLPSASPQLHRLFLSSFALQYSLGCFAQLVVV